MDNNRWKVSAAAWIATAIGVVAGLYFTRSPWCMWAFMMPLMAS